MDVPKSNDCHSASRSTSSQTAKHARNLRLGSSFHDDNCYTEVAQHVATNSRRVPSYRVASRLSPSCILDPLPSLTRGVLDTWPTSCALCGIERWAAVVSLDDGAGTGSQPRRARGFLCRRTDCLHVDLDLITVAAEAGSVSRSGTDLVTAAVG